jgi:hypothetical protein
MYVNDVYHDIGFNIDAYGSALNFSLMLNPLHSSGH